MSGISSVGVSQNLNSYLQLPSDDSSRAAPSAEQHEQRVAKHEQRLEESLLAAGVNEETAKAIKSDLKAAFEESFSNNEGPPDHEAIKENIDNVFAEYGLDASQFVGGPGAGGPGGPGGPPPGGRPPGGPPPSGAASKAAGANSVDSESEEYQTILELLESLSEQGEADSSQQAQLIVDALYGIDKLA